MRSSPLHKSISLYPKNIIDLGHRLGPGNWGDRCSTLGRVPEKGPGFSAWAWGYRFLRYSSISLMMVINFFSSFFLLG